MANIESLRPNTSGPVPQAASPIGGTQPTPAAFQTADGDQRLTDDRLTGLLAFALATERREDTSPETVTRLKQEADAALCDHAIRYLHNNVEQLRQEAVAQQLGRLPRPPGLLRLVTANLVALAVAGAGAGWLALHPQTLAGITGFLAG